MTTGANAPAMSPPQGRMSLRLRQLVERELYMSANAFVSNTFVRRRLVRHRTPTLLKKQTKTSLEKVTPNLAFSKDEASYTSPQRSRTYQTSPFCLVHVAVLNWLRYTHNAALRSISGLEDRIGPTRSALIVFLSPNTPFHIALRVFEQLT